MIDGFTRQPWSSPDGRTIYGGDGRIVGLAHGPERSDVENAANGELLRRAALMYREFQASLAILQPVLEKFSDTRVLSVESQKEMQQLLLQLRTNIKEVLK